MEEKEIQIKLHTIATYNNKEYELQDLCNGLLEQIYNKDKEIERLKEELDINNRLIDGIEDRLINHFRKIDRLVCDDTSMLIVIRDLIKQAKGEDKE